MPMVLIEDKELFYKDISVFISTFNTVLFLFIAVENC